VYCCVTICSNISRTQIKELAVFAPLGTEENLSAGLPVSASMVAAYPAGWVPVPSRKRQCMVVLLF
jgi:hypothetical protein